MLRHEIILNGILTFLFVLVKSDTIFVCMSELTYPVMPYVSLKKVYSSTRLLAMVSLMLAVDCNVGYKQIMYVNKPQIIFP